MVRLPCLLVRVMLLSSSRQCLEFLKLLQTGLLYRTIPSLGKGWVGVRSVSDLACGTHGSRLSSIDHCMVPGLSLLSAKHILLCQKLERQSWCSCIRFELRRRLLNNILIDVRLELILLLLGHGCHLCILESVRSRPGLIDKSILDLNLIRDINRVLCKTAMWSLPIMTILDSHAGVIDMYLNPTRWTEYRIKVANCGPVDVHRCLCDLLFRLVRIFEVRQWPIIESSLVERDIRDAQLNWSFSHSWLLVGILQSSISCFHQVVVAPVCLSDGVDHLCH